MNFIAVYKYACDLGHELPNRIAAKVSAKGSQRVSSPVQTNQIRLFSCVLYIRTLGIDVDLRHVRILKDIEYNCCRMKSK